MQSTAEGQEREILWGWSRRGESSQHQGPRRSAPFLRSSQLTSCSSLAAVVQRCGVGLNRAPVFGLRVKHSSLS